jgi:hypothetical protein
LGGVEAKAEELALGRVTPSPAPGVEILEIALVESDADDPAFAGCLRPGAERFALTFHGVFKKS